MKMICEKIEFILYNLIIYFNDINNMRNNLNGYIFLLGLLFNVSVMRTGQYGK